MDRDSIWSLFFFFFFLSFPVSCQDDKDLVHEFVVAEGLTCLIKVGAEADQNYQNYILRGKWRRAWGGQPLLQGGSGVISRNFDTESFLKDLVME